ncbi:MAG: hypothetical protein JRH15_23385, partial [Deltaproteobacteria bacterium]|nr:hypothetical protein [Deltaproteobacteria bacterium]
LIGKNNMHEFAYGATNLNEYIGDTRNPWDPDRITGGSSGGSAAAIAGSCCLLALGSDTGGSIRIPAALCGIVGLKPTFGRVSKHGLFPLNGSQDHIGPMTRTVADAAIALACIAGHDPKDPHAAQVPVDDYPGMLTGDIRGVRIGVPDTFYFDRLDGDVLDTFKQGISIFEDLGAIVKTVHIPDLYRAEKATWMILYSEAADSLEKYHKRQRKNMGRDVCKRLDEGAAISAADLLKAQQFRSTAQLNFAHVFETVDVLLTPGTSIPAPKPDQSHIMFETDSVPVGEALSHCSHERMVLRVAHAYENNKKLSGELTIYP